jgi:hypothetical protein
LFLSERKFRLKPEISAKKRKNPEGSLLVNRKGKNKTRSLNELEEKLIANELSLYEEALQLDRKRKASYIH